MSQKLSKPVYSIPKRITSAGYVGIRSCVRGGRFNYFCSQNLNSVVLYKWINKSIMQIKIYFK